MRGGSVKLRIKARDVVLSATLVDSSTARDFVALLPLTLTMNDLFGREKFGSLPRPLAAGGDRTHTYEIGDIAYWSPGPDIAIYYRDDGQRIPDPGIVLVAKITAGVEALRVAGSMVVTIELEEAA
jgi:hypothetical protein